MNVAGPGLLSKELHVEPNIKAPATSEQLRLERDRQRGYSINTKQIVLAFAVEFTIIGLILTNTFLTAAQLADATALKTTQAMLFPIAMAMVELARVPLAVAVRTQTSWNIKLAALLGVLCAVAVTSNSLSSIGASSFNPRLEDTHRTDSSLRELKDKKEVFRKEEETLESDYNQRRAERDALAQSMQALSKQLTEQPMQNCSTVTRPSPSPNCSYNLIVGL